MPRSRSIAIQSERVRRRSPRARTAPAMRMAPPFRSSFSVSVVLPASGCEMMAKVRRALPVVGRSRPPLRQIVSCRPRAVRRWIVLCGHVSAITGDVCQARSIKHRARLLVGLRSKLSPSELTLSA